MAVVRITITTRIGWVLLLGVAVAFAPGATPVRASADVRSQASPTKVSAEDLMLRADTLRRTRGAGAATEVRDLYRKAISRWEKTRKGCGARRAWVALSSFEHDLVNAESQKRAALAALGQSCTDDPSQQALAQRLLGSAYINQGDFAAGAEATERAVALFRQTGEQNEEGAALRNLGLAYAESGQIERALRTTQSALEILQRTGDDQLLALVRNDIAFIHAARGEFALAIEAYRHELEVLRAKPAPMAEAVSWINLGLAYGQLGEAEEAVAAYDQGATVAARIDCWSCLAEVDVDRADDLLDAGKTAAARATYERALSIAKQHQLKRQHAEALRGLGRCAMKAGQWTEARSLLTSARDELHLTRGRVNEAVAETLLADLDERLGQPVAARRGYQRALSLARAASNYAWQAAAEASLARVAKEAGDLGTARRRIEQAIALIESERNRIDAPDLRTTYFGTKRSYYSLYIEILMQFDGQRPGEGYAAQALIIAERARARELQGELIRRAVRVDAGVDPNLLTAERAAADQLRAWAYQLSQVAPSEEARRQGLQKQLDEASQKLDDVRGRIRGANPRYSELTHPAPLSPDEIQHRLLDENVTVLEYWLDERHSYVWVVTQGALRAFILPPRSAIEDRVFDLRDQLLAPGRLAASVPIEQRAANESRAVEAAHASASRLAADILPPAARTLLRPMIAVIADGALQTVPFAALNFGLVPESPSSSAFTYVNLPSIGTLRGLRMLPHTRAAPKTLAVLADPVFRADDDRLRKSANPSSGRAGTVDATASVVLRAASEAGLADLPRLPFSREEARAIGSLADGRSSWIALDFAANRESALSAPWSNYAIVHFATHALLNARHPDLSGILLSLYDANGRAEDGFLRVNDIYNLNIPADLVVLSVCDSAVGKDVGAEGPATLARAFFYAGSRRVIASLWPVDDRASVAFMRELYRALLLRGLPPQEALASAQQSLQENPRWRAPYYWAPYIVEGDWR